MTPETTELPNADRNRILQSTFSSTEDLEGLRSPSMEEQSPYISSNESTEDLELLHTKGKNRQSRHRRMWSLGSIGSMEKPRWSVPPSLTRLRNVVGIVGIFALLAFLSTWWHATPDVVKAEKWVKPEGFKIIAFVFYGRPPTVSILDCYLKRNLVSNGGFLDEVHWFANTDILYDLNYLDVLTNSSDLYIKKEMNETGYQHIWENAVEPGTMYLKIDDDMVYIDDDTIPRMVYAKLNHPEAFDIAANIVNSPLTNWFHWHRDAVYPYLPESNPLENFTKIDTPNNEWRASSLPMWNSTNSSNSAERYFDFESHEYQMPVPYDGHRWLPLPNTSANLLKTPIASAEYNPWGRGWNRWAVGAQQHYSFLENLEKGQMEKYYFAGSDGLWNMQYDRYNLNFLIVWGDDVLLQPPSKDDEQDFTVEFPRNHTRPLLIDTHAVVSHFSFGPQSEIYKTDLLSRYRAYANEFVCAPDAQLKPMELHY